MAIVPKGDGFLPDCAEDELIASYKREEDPKAKIRLLAVVLRKEGKTLKEISDIVKYPLTTVGDWLRRIHLEGISRIHNTKQIGRPKSIRRSKKSTDKPKSKTS